MYPWGKQTAPMFTGEDDMARAGYKPREFGSLKEAVNALVNLNGGIRDAAAACRVQGASLFRYTDDSDENNDRHMPVDVVAELESQAGVPIVTEYLAWKANHHLLPVAFEASQSDLNIDLVDASSEVAKLFEDWALAVANDGIIDRKEAKELLLHSIDLVRVLMRMRADLEARIADPNTPDGPENATEN